MSRQPVGTSGEGGGVGDTEVRRLREDMDEFESEELGPQDPQPASQFWVGVTVANPDVDGLAFPTGINVFFWVKPLAVSGQEIAGDVAVFGDKQARIDGVTKSRKAFNLGSTLPIEGVPTDSKGGSVVTVCDVEYRSVFWCNGTEPLYAGDPPP